MVFADMDHDPSMEARAARKARTAKNERQRQQNLKAAGVGIAEQHEEQQDQKKPAQAQQRKKAIERTLATTRASTASMGKFDRMLEGEKKARGMKRKVPHYVFVRLISMVLIFVRFCALPFPFPP